MLVAGALLTMGADMPPNHKLRCELRGNENATDISFSAQRPEHLHFILFSHEDGLKVYAEWNSWGYAARSFTATDAQSKAYNISRRARGWSRNAPTTQTIAKGDFLMTDIYLCDGTWRVEPKLPAGPVKLKVIGHFQNSPGADAKRAGVWTGEIQSPPVEVSLEKECVERLNG